MPARTASSARPTTSGCSRTSRPSSSSPPGTPPTCDDGDPCNGAETCHPVLGCQPGTALNCDDGAACTQDACVAGVGCTHSSIPGCCVADADCIDTNLCNGSEICASGNCI